MAQKQSLDSAERSSPCKRVCPTVGDEVEISKILEAQPKATVHGVVVGLSPVKDNRKEMIWWWDCWQWDRHFVSFDSGLWHANHVKKEVLLSWRTVLFRSLDALSILIMTRQKWIHLHGSSSLMTELIVMLASRCLPSVRLASYHRDHWCPWWWRYKVLSHQRSF